MAGIIVELLREQHQDEAQLIESCKLGDSAGFDTLVNRYKDRVYNVAYRFLGNHEDAQDVAQEVFIRAYRGIQDFEGRSRIFTWLYSITGNLSRNKLRDASRKGRDKGQSLESLQETAQETARGIAGSQETPDRIAQSHELQTLLQQCVEELPEQYRMVFVLRTFDQLSYDEIAESVGCPKGTVKSRLNQARMQLRDRLKVLSVI